MDLRTEARDRFYNPHFAHCRNRRTGLSLDQQRCRQGELRQRESDAASCGERSCGRRRRRQLSRTHACRDARPQIARRQFFLPLANRLREFGHLAEAFTRLALSHPAIHFTLKHNDRPIHDLPPTSDLAERVVAFFGSEFEGRLIAIESSEGDIRLTGYVTEPSITRANNRMQVVKLARELGLLSE